MVPALMILLGVPGHIAVGTGLAVMFFNSSFGMYRRRGSGTVDFNLAVTLASGSVFGVVLGLWIMELLKAMRPLVILGKEQSPVQYILLCLFLLLLALIAVVMFFDLNRNSGRAPEKRIGLFAKIKMPPFVCFSSLEEPKVSLIPIILLGFGVGMLTGLLGVGGGIVMMPALVYLIGQRTPKAAGTSLALVWISSLAAVAGHISAGNLHPRLMCAMMAGGIIGTGIGTHIGLKLAGPKIRRYFIYILALAVLIVAVKLWRMTFA
ncbi:unnamed protein product [marine sediment metagenome]|uniref:Membrane transporter protein n=1 Tax=marine sediment metagenome TaxID=412755 RepID=X1RZA2_9ZZZZ